MIDEIESRLWAEHHEAFSNEIAAALRRLWLGFRTAHAHLYDAPWRPRVRPCR